MDTLYQLIFYVCLCAYVHLGIKPTKIMCLITFCKCVVTYQQTGQSHKVECGMK